MRNVIVTGGAGYIGSHTCKALFEAGYCPVVYDSLVRGNAKAVKWGPLEVGDVLDGDHVRKVIRKYRPVGVIHFAALAYVGESMSSPLLYYKNNISGTVSLLEAMEAERLERIVFSSTCATYGSPETATISENMQQFPINPYGRTKLFVEQLLRDCAKSGSVRSVALRYFNAAGADPSCEIGEDHVPETHLIPLTLGAARGTSPPLTVFGSDHSTPDGTCIRDYIHVTDLADAHVRALSYTAKANGFTAFNIGTGVGNSVMEIITAAQDITGCAVPYSIGPRRDGDPSMLVADTYLARDVLGWKATHSDLHNMLKTAWNWMCRN